MNSKKIILVLRVAVAIILIQTLRFKFTAHPDSVYIFETVGLEPFGRIGIGILELIAGLISGAIMMHLTQLGIEIKGDGGVLFYTAIITFLLSLIILYNHRKEIPIIGKKLSF